MRLTDIPKISKILSLFLKQKSLIKKDPSALSNYRLNRLKKIIDNAYYNIPLYRKKFDFCGFHPSDFRTLEDFHKVPILTKEELREEYLRGLSYCGQQKGRWFGTTGSTGSSVKVFYPRKKIYGEMALISPAFCKLMYNIKIKKGLMVLVLEPDSVETMGYYEIEHPGMKYIDVFADLNKIINAINKHNPTAMCIYPSRLKELLDHIEDKMPPVLSIPVIFTGGEMLDQSTRKRAETIFNSKVYESYAATETGVMALETRNHQGLQVFSWKSYIEILDDDGKTVPEGATGNIIVTDLDNDVMPIIRYSGLGDCASYLDQKKEILGPIQGRKVDFLKKKCGELVHPFKVTLAMQNIQGIRKYQVQQHNLDQFKVIIEPSNMELDINEVQSEIQNNLNKLFGETDLTLELVNEIARRNNGHKHSPVVCLLQ